MFQTKFDVKIRTHFLFNNFLFFRKSRRLWYNMRGGGYVIDGQVTDDSMAHAHCLRLATHSEYAILTFPQQQWSHASCALVSLSTSPVVLGLLQLRVGTAQSVWLSCRLGSRRIVTRFPARLQSFRNQALFQWVPPVPFPGPKSSGASTYNSSSSRAEVTNECSSTSIPPTPSWSTQEHLLLYVYWTVHRLNNWIKNDQLDVTCFVTSLFNAQHVSDVNTSILRSLRLICWVISRIVLLWFDVCWCYVVVWLWWCGIRMQATPPQPNHNVTPTHIEPEQYNPWNNSTNKSQAPQDGCINIRNMLSIK